jgi:chromate transport protein ChrA
LGSRTFPHGNTGRVGTVSSERVRYTFWSGSGFRCDVATAYLAARYLLAILHADRYDLSGRDPPAPDFESRRYLVTRPLPLSQSERLGEVARVFLTFGFTAFGGPAAHIAMMHRELVQRRHWVSEERFLDLLGLSNVIPGPSSTELAIYLGYQRAGWRGLVVAGTMFILPAIGIVLFLAWLYTQLGTLPQFGWVFTASSRSSDLITGLVRERVRRASARQIWTPARCDDILGA